MNPPTGFVLDTPPATASQTAPQIPPPPPGFVAETAPAVQPPPPPGFVLDTPDLSRLPPQASPRSTAGSGGEPARNPEDFLPFVKSYAPLAIRLGANIGAAALTDGLSIPAQIAANAGASALAEGPAQAAEKALGQRQDYSLKEGAVNTLAGGAIPLLPGGAILGKVGAEGMSLVPRLATKAAVGAGEGALFATGQGAASRAVQGQPNTLTTAAHDALAGSLFGGVIGPAASEVVRLFSHNPDALNAIGALAKDGRPDLAAEVIRRESAKEADPARATDMQAIAQHIDDTVGQSMGLVPPAARTGEQAASDMTAALNDDRAAKESPAGAAALAESLGQQESAAQTQARLDAQRKTDFLRARAAEMLEGIKARQLSEPPQGIPPPPAGFVPEDNHLRPTVSKEAAFQAMEAENPPPLSRPPPSGPTQPPDGGSPAVLSTPRPDNPPAPVLAAPLAENAANRTETPVNPPENPSNADSQPKSVEILGNPPPGHPAPLAEGGSEQAGEPAQPRPLAAGEAAPAGGSAGEVETPEAKLARYDAADQAENAANEARREAPLDPDAVGGVNNPILAKSPDEIYDASLEDFREASRKFTAISKAYRAKAIGDPEFIAARKEFDAAKATSDQAETDFIAAKNAAAKAAKAEKAKPAPLAESQPSLPAVANKGMRLTPEEEARADALQEQNRVRLSQLSENQKSQLGVELGNRAEMTDAHVLDNTHPDDLRAALDTVQSMGKKPVVLAEKKATVERTPDGPAIRPLASADHQVSRLADKTQIRVQKQFLSSALKEAIKAAPEDQKLDPIGQGLMDRLNTGDDVPALAKHYGYDYKADRSKGNQPSLNGLIEMAIRNEHGEHVTIDVPGDGTFRVPNTQKNLANFAEKVGKKFGTGLANKSKPEAPSSRPSPIAAQAKKVTPSDITDAVGLSKRQEQTGDERDPNRARNKPLGQVIQDGNITVATDGRRLTAAVGGDGVKLDKGMNLPDGTRYPQWRQVVSSDTVKITPTSIKSEGKPRVTADAGEVIKMLDGIEALRGKNEDSVGLHDVDGKLGISYLKAGKGRVDPTTGIMESNEEMGGSYHSEGATPENRFSTVDPDYLRDMMVQARKLGGNDVPIHSVDEKSPIVGFIGKNAVNITMPKRAGFISPVLSAHLAGGAAGAAYGSTQGDTPEERLKNAVTYGLLGTLSVWAARHAINAYGPATIAALKNPAEATQPIREGLQNAYLRFKGEALPNLARLAPKSADAAIAFGSADSGAHATASALAGRVLGEHIHDPEFAAKLGSVLNEDNLRGLKDSKQRQIDALTAEHAVASERLKQPDLTPAEKTGIHNRLIAIGEEIPKLAEARDAVVSTIGREDSTFKTEAEYRAALADPEIKAALARHMAQGGVQDTAEQSHEATGGVKRAAGLETGAFANLLPKQEEAEPSTAVPAAETPPPLSASPAGGGRGNLQNPRLRKTVHGQEFTGTAPAYENDYNQIADKMVTGNYAEKLKRDMYSQLEEDGLAKQTNAGDPRPADDEKTGLPFIKYELLPGNKAIYIRSDVNPEVRRVLNVDSRITGPLKTFAHAVNALQLAQPIDAAAHAANMVSVLNNAPGGKNVIEALARKTPGVNVATTIGELVSRKAELVADSQPIREQLMRLGSGGMLRPESHGAFAPTFINTMDRAARLVMDDIYTDLVNQGRAVDTTAGRRNFVNQLGQYNPRLMSGVQLALRESGISPFVVAGKAMNRNAVRAISGGSGVEAPTVAAAAKMRATQLGGALATLLAVPVVANLATTGKPFGRPGVQFGKIDTGTDDAQGNHITLDPARWTGARRGLRLTGTQALIDGIQNDKGADLTGGAMARDAFTGVMHPYFGPLANFVYGGATGESLGGYRVSKEVNQRSDQPSLTQYTENLKASGGALNAYLNPLVSGATQQNKTLPQNLGGALLNAAGVSTARPSTPEEGRAAAAANAENQQRTADYQSAQMFLRSHGLTNPTAAPPTPDQQAKAQAEFKAASPSVQAEITRQYQTLLKSPGSRIQSQLGVADLTRANTLRAERDAIADPAARTAYLQRKVDDKVLTPEVKEQLDALDAYPVVSKYPQAQKVQFFNSLTPKQQAIFNQIAEQQAKR